MKLSERLRSAMEKQQCGLSIHGSFIKELEAQENDLVLALETTQTLQSGISWFNVDEEEAIMEKLYTKYQVGWGKNDQAGKTQAKKV